MVEYWRRDAGLPRHGESSNWLESIVPRRGQVLVPHMLCRCADTNTCCNRRPAPRTRRGRTLRLAALAIRDSAGRSPPPPGCARSTPAAASRTRCQPLRRQQPAPRTRLEWTSRLVAHVTRASVGRSLRPPLARSSPAAARQTGAALSGRRAHLLRLGARVMLGSAGRSPPTVLRRTTAEAVPQRAALPTRRAPACLQETAPAMLALVGRSWRRPQARSSLAAVPHAPRQTSL